MESLDQLFARFAAILAPHLADEIANRVVARLANKQEPITVEPIDIVDLEPASAVPAPVAVPAALATAKPRRKAWIKRGNQRHHLTEEGRAHMDELIRKGTRYPAIAKELGITLSAVYQRKKKLMDEGVQLPPTKPRSGAAHAG